MSSVIDTTIYRYISLRACGYATRLAELSARFAGVLTEVCRPSTGTTNGPLARPHKRPGRAGSQHQRRKGERTFARKLTTRMVASDNVLRLCHDWQTGASVPGLRAAESGRHPGIDGPAPVTRARDGGQARVYGVGHTSPVLQATRTFRGLVDGEWIEVRAGATRVDERHPLARRYPSSFEPVSGTRRGGRWSDIDGTACHRDVGGVGVGGYVNVDTRPTTTRRLPRKARGTQSWWMPLSSATCELLDRPSKTKVRFAGDARARAIATMDKFIDREAHFKLVGRVSNNLIEVLDVTQLSIGDEYRVKMNWSDPPEDVLGEIHSHVIHDWGCLTGAPSPQDLDNWARLRRHFELPAFLGVIAIPLADRWELRPYVVRFGSAHRDIAERCLAI